MMNILVTGGLGYIGSHTVVELVEAGYNPIIIDNLSNSTESVLSNIEKILNQRITFIKGDCKDVNILKQIFERFSFDGVIHFAAYKSVNESIEKPLEYFENNVGSLITLSKVMEEFESKHLIFSSSCTVYGQPDELPVTEETPFKEATSAYGRTKQICEMILRDLPKIKSIALRYFNPIGAHHSGLIGELPNGVPNNLVPYITQTAIGKRKELKVFGADYDTKDGSCIRDFIHVVDLAKAHVKALEYLFNNDNVRISGRPYNIGTGNGSTVLELISAFEKVNQTKLSYSLANRRAGDIEKIYANSEKANKELNWGAKFTLENALADAWRWEKNLKDGSLKFKEASP